MVTITRLIVLVVINKEVVTNVHKDPDFFDSFLDQTSHTQQALTRNRSRWVAGLGFSSFGVSHIQITNITKHQNLKWEFDIVGLAHIVYKPHSASCLACSC